ncbi:MAG: hypothetical protein WC175_05835 [Candidatus Dojkabacteria bacterium]
MLLHTEDQDLERNMTKLGNKLILETMEELEIPSSSLENLNERTIVKIDKKARLSQFAARSATIIAREKNDPLYKKMSFHRRKFLEFREMIRTKYASKAIQRARLAVKTGKLTDPNKKSNLEPKEDNKF